MTQPIQETQIRISPTASAWWYLAGGALFGLAAGLLLAPWALTELRAREDETADSSEAYSEIKQKMSQKKDEAAS